MAVRHSGFDFLPGGGEMGGLIRSIDWSRTPLGRPEGWSPALRATLPVVLASSFPMLIWWGPEHVQFYNDAYVPIPGTKHPRAMGQRGEECWAEIWDVLKPLVDAPMAGRATWIDDIFLVLERHGFPEETHFVIAYSPIPDTTAANGIGGVLATVHEITGKIVGERRVRLLGELGARTAEAQSAEDACRIAAEILARHPEDVPFAAIYLLDEDGRTARLAAAAGVAEGESAAPRAIELADAAAAWPMAEAAARDDIVIVERLAERLARVPAGPGATPPSAAAMVPIKSTVPRRPAGLLVAGISALLKFDDLYRGFFELVAAQIATAVGKARAYEAERRRAEALAEIDKAKTAFFSNISHEFRTPLTLMLGPLDELAEKTGGAPAEQALVDIARRNGLRLLKLVNSLLDFSRIEAGRVEATYAPVDLAALTADIASAFRSALERAGLGLRVTLEPLPGPVHVDGEMWEKILLNLLSNAFKFTFEGEVSVAVRASADGRCAEIVVRDTGIGIAREDLPRIFERFHRVENARGRTFEGSGIGLALVQELVRLHGGSIEVDSEIGRGSRFTIRLPFGTAHLPAERIRDAASAVHPGLRAAAFVEEAVRWLPENATTAGAADRDHHARHVAGHGEHILLADDNADMRAYIRRLLIDEGFAVTAVADGEQALAAIRAARPDLLLTDVMMPRLDGIGLLRAVRDDPGLRDLPVLLLSARAGEEARLEGLAVGADDYLIKPFSARELVARIGSSLLLARARREREAALRDEAETLETLNRVGATVAVELDLDRMVQVVVDAGTELTRAAFGAFFYNVANEQGESYTLYSLSGAPRHAFDRFPMPRNTEVFAPTFEGGGVVRADDITKDPRYGHNAPHFGMPKGHLPVRSYLAAPVISRSGQVLGGLFFGHPEPAMFSHRAERLVVGIAAHAAIAIDNVRQYQAAQQEIERRKQTEAALRVSEGRAQRLNEELEARVRRRTADLQTANEQLKLEAAERARIESALRQAQKMEVIGQLTGGVAHDFNNLLTVVIGNLETLERRLGRGETGQRLTRASSSALQGARRAATLTKSLLAFARRQPLDPKPLDASRLIIGMIDLLRRTLGERISVETVMGAGLWGTFVDRNQLESAILNLAINARDAMPGGGKLTVETANVDLDAAYAERHAEVAPGQYVAVAVTDTGSGMTPEVLGKAFDPFFTTKEVGQGTGLGLSQVYGFVKQSGGHVTIDSEIGRGTTVTLYLPRQLASVEEAEAVMTAPAVPRGSPDTLVLVVEDDAQVRAYTTEILAELGYRVVAAPDAKTALAMLEREPGIRLLFTDIGLPGGMNGRDLADAAQQRHADLKVLFTTAYARDAILHGGRLDPDVQLIPKPFTYAALAAKLQALLDPGAVPSTILVVEDEPLIRLLAMENLEELGFKVEEAGSATEALGKLRRIEGRIAAALVDIGLPDRPGDQLIAELRTIDAELPVIVASGGSTRDLAGKLRGLDRVAFLEKPFQEDALEQSLRSLGIAIPQPR